MKALTGMFRECGPGSGSGLPWLSFPNSAETETCRAPAAASLLLADGVIASLPLTSDSEGGRGDSMVQLKEVPAE